MPDVSTRLVHPAFAYRLEAFGETWTFGHPVWWPVKPAIGMDANEPWGDVDSAKQAFYEYVADSVVWPDGAENAKDILAKAKIAAKEREKIAAGVIELF